MAARITIVSAGHMAHCPRMVKAADALVDAGYQVRVVSGVNDAWAIEADRRLHARRKWRWRPVPYGRADAPVRWLTSAARSRAASAVAGLLGEQAPAHVTAQAFSRLHHDLTRAILEEPSDLIYGGSSGAVAAIVEAAQTAGVVGAVDFEDFHCAQHGSTPEGVRLDRLASEVMAAACRQAAFVTAGSGAIADACEARFGRPVIPVHNVFPLPAAPPRPRAASDGLALYWFSQTIGPGRGLEDIVAGAGRAGITATLHLRGMPAGSYVDELAAQAATQAPLLRIVRHAPVDPDDIIESCAPFDAGIASEPGGSPNNAMALSNKALTYPLAGLGLILSDTPGQRPLAESVGRDAIVYRAGDTDALADGLRRWSADAASLRRAREAAWEAARRRWHWEHAAEREALVGAVASTLG
jgi:hypothetical protein